MGIPNTLKTFTDDSRSIVGLELILDEETKEPLIRFLVRLRKIWTKADSEQPFPSILFVADANLGATKGVYFRNQSTILIRFSELEDYFRSGGLISLTLQHELRHASFFAFEKQIATSPHAIHLPVFISEKGLLATGELGYAKFASSEEPSIYYRQFLAQLLRSRTVLKKELRDGILVPYSRSGALLIPHVEKANAFGNSTLLMTAGIQAEGRKTLLAMLGGKAKIRFSESTGKASVVRAEDAVLTIFPCPGCGQTASSSVEKNVIAYLKSAFMVSLPVQDARTTALKKASARMNALNLRRIEAENTESKPITKAEIIEAFDEAIRVLNSASLRKVTEL